MATRTIIEVERCADCPFFERTAVSVIADFLMKSANVTGACKHGGIGQPFPLGRRHIPDERVAPSDCPLRDGSTTIAFMEHTKR